MQVTHTIKINVSIEKLWNTLRSFDKVESYMPIVSSTLVKGSGQGAKRICELNLGAQIYKIREKLDLLDDLNYRMIISVEDGPIQMRGMNFTIALNKIEEQKTNVTIITNVENSLAAAFSQNIFVMMGTGLKKLHE